MQQVRRQVCDRLTLINARLALLVSIFGDVQFDHDR